jgi:hypothetical protein
MFPERLIECVGIRIHTVELAKIDVFGYLVALQRHYECVAEDQAAWMPWNYTRVLALVPRRDPPT